DPVTGNFLIMGNGQLWEYDPSGQGRWTLQSGSRTPPSAVGNPGSPNFDSVISAPISNYGVVTYITCRASTCNMYLYKHASSGPPDTTPPTVSITSPGAGAILSGRTTVIGAAADDLGVTAVQVRVDDGSFSPATGTSTWRFVLETDS